MFTEPIKRATISKTTSINTERVLDFFHLGGYNMIIKPEKEVSKALYEQIVALKDKEACYRFFQDLCSITELRAMEQRYDVAKLLYEGKVYTDIVETTGASSATISRVNRALKYGENGLLDALEQQ